MLSGEATEDYQGARMYVSMYEYMHDVHVCICKCHVCMYVCMYMSTNAWGLIIILVVLYNTSICASVA